MWLPRWADNTSTRFCDISYEGKLPNGKRATTIGRSSFFKIIFLI